VEGACGVDGELEVLCQPPVSPDPGKEPLDDPTPRVYDKADLIGILAYNLDRDQRCPCALFTRISAISEDPLDEREDTTRNSQQRTAAIAILDARRMRFEYEAAPIGVDECMAFTSVDLLARIVAAGPASLGRLDALAINDRTGWTGITPNPFAVEHDQRVINLLEAAFVTEIRKPAINCAPRRQIAR
jgi:hypothetical protein